MNATRTPTDGSVGAIKISLPLRASSKSSTAKAMCGTILTISGTWQCGSNRIHSIRRDWSQNRRREPRGARHDAPEHEAACVESRYGGTAIRASLSRQAAHGSVAFRESRLSSSISLTDYENLVCRVCRTVELT